MPEISRRAHERRNVEWISIIRHEDGSEFPCTIKDVSAAGMRLALSELIPLEEMFFVKVVGKNLVFRVRRVWRRQHHAGLAIIAIGKLQQPHVPADKRPSEGPSPQGYIRIGGRQRYHPRSSERT